MFLFIVLLFAALFSAIPLNVLLRVLGDDRARLEGGKSIMAMYSCYGLVVAYWQFYARPQQVEIGVGAAFLGWFLIVFGVVFAMFGMGAKKTLIIAMVMATLLSPVGFQLAFWQSAGAG
ncbi:MAG: hypothetical protein WAV95_17890 [Azonexus sp.]